MIILEISETNNGTFHAKMGTIKDRNDMDLMEAEFPEKGCSHINNQLKNSSADFV